MNLGSFRFIRVTDTAASLIGEIELAAFSVGAAENPEDTDAAYVGLNAARKALYTYIESVEKLDVSRQRKHLRRF